jgi:heat shock protein HtpX
MLLKEIARNKRRSVAIVVLFVLVWVAIGAFIGWLSSDNGSSSPTQTCDPQATLPDGTPLGCTTVTHRGAPPEVAIPVGMAIAALLAAGSVVVALKSGSKLVLAASGARPADPDQYRQLHNVVEEMALSAGLPKPAVYVIDDPSPNAFATGISPQRASITATTGLLEMMNREELEGVIAHETSHIKNYDVRLILIVSTLIGLAALLASLAWRSLIFTRPRGRDGEQAAVLVLAVATMLTLVAVVVGPLIRFALSRSREELADVSGANLTRNPMGLAHALEKLEGNDKPFAKFNHATAAMCIDDPLQHHSQWYHHLFDTHPPIEERIAILEKIAQGQTGDPGLPPSPSPQND